MAVTTSQVQSLYVAYFGRPAEQAGLTYWTAQANATVDQISAAFAQQAEYTSVYGSLSRAQTIDTLYQNLFGRAAQSNELNYWLNSSDITVDRLALALVNGATGTDRVLLDSKVQFASAVTTQLGASGTSDQVNTAYDTVVNGTIPANTTVTQYYTNATNTALNTVKFAINGDAFANGNGLAASNAGAATGVANFFSATNVTIAATNAGAATVALPGTSAATTLSVNGTVGDVAGTTADATTLTFTETLASGETTQTLTNLNLGLSNSAVAPTATNIVATNIDSLASIDGSASSAGLTINATNATITSTTTAAAAITAVAASNSELSNLTSLKGGSGNDSLYVSTVDGSSTITTKALTVDGGAGNDVIVGVTGEGVLTLNGGLGNDTISLTTLAATSAASVINAGAGNDTVNLAVAGSTSTATTDHTVNVTLGDGNDTLNVTSLTNLNGTFTTGSATLNAAANTAIAQDLVKVTDFSGTQDKMVLTTGGASFVALDNTQTGTVQGAASLAEAVAAAASIIGSATFNGQTSAAAHSTSFTFGGNTYVFVNDANTTVNSNDGLIELTGYTGGLSAANFATA